MKTCSKCNEHKPLDAFHVQPTGKLGRRADCKSCASRHKKKYNADPATKAARAKSRATYYAQNSLAIRRNARRYYQQTPSVWWEFAYRRRCTDYGLTPVVEHFTRADLIAQWGDECFDCGDEWAEIDHVLPVRFGGPHTLENCQPVCSSCNYARWEHQKALHDWTPGRR